MENAKQMQHTLFLEGRQRLSLSGIEDVISFDETVVVLSTTQGTLAIEGEGLHILQMNVDSKEFRIEGKVCALNYIERRQRGKGLFKTKQ